MDQAHISVLMTGAGAPGGPGIIEALMSYSGIELTVADANPYASGRAVHADFVTIPKAGHPDFINALLSVCRQKNIRIILPLVTRELEILASEREMFDNEGIKIVVSDIKQLAIANNKRCLLEKLDSEGLAVSTFTVARNVSELEASVIRMGYPEKPVVIKPSVSNGSRGMRVLSESLDLADAFFSQKPDNTYTTLSRVMEVLRGYNIPEMLVMEYLPGDEYSVDCLLNNGEPLFILPRKRIKMNSGISVAGEFENNTEIIEYVKSVFRIIPLHGPVGVQVKQNSDGKFSILEINPRLQGSTTTALGMGMNIPLYAVLQAAGLNVSDLIPEPQWGLKFVRYYRDAFLH